MARQETFESIADPRLQSVVDAVWSATGPASRERPPANLLERSGILVQVTPVTVGGGTPLEEWVIERPDGSVLVVATRSLTGEAMLGRFVRLEGRSAGEIEARSRDGRTRRWPLFVGRPVGSRAAGTDASPWIAGAVAVLAPGLLLLRHRIRRRDSSGPGRGIPSTTRSKLGSGVRITSEPMSLPSDPAEALEVLAAGRPSSEPFVIHRRRLEFEHASSTLLVGRGLLPRAGELIATSLGASKRGGVVVGIDPGREGVVEATQAPRLVEGLRNLGEVTSVRVEASESAKSMAAVETLWEGMLRSGLDRGGLVVALGGGITCDVVGFAASGWMRGVDLVLCPTTLLGMVDAAIGGKTGVNRSLPDGGLGKNLVGAFWPARLVICDCEVLETLDERDFRAGLAECVKHAIIDGPDAMSALELELPGVLDRDPETLVRFIDRSAGVKIGIVERDPREAGDRALLNLGHTFAHAIESRTEFGLVHGEAVAVGLVAACRAATAAGLSSDPGLEDRVRAILQVAGLPTRLEGVGKADLDQLIGVMQIDKKAHLGRIRLVLPRATGDVVVVDDPGERVVRAGWEAVIGDA